MIRETCSMQSDAWKAAGRLQEAGYSTRIELSEYDPAQPGGQTWLVLAIPFVHTPLGSVGLGVGFDGGSEGGPVEALSPDGVHREDTRLIVEGIGGGIGFSKGAFLESNHGDVLGDQVGVVVGNGGLIGGGKQHGMVAKILYGDGIDDAVGQE